MAINFLKKRKNIDTNMILKESYEAKRDGTISQSHELLVFV
jgi:hypothetical protein